MHVSEKRSYNRHPDQNARKHCFIWKYCFCLKVSHLGFKSLFCEGYFTGKFEGINFRPEECFRHVTDTIPTCMWKNRRTYFEEKPALKNLKLLKVHNLSRLWQSIFTWGTRYKHRQIWDVLNPSPLWYSHIIPTLPGANAESSHSGDREVVMGSTVT